MAFDFGQGLSEAGKAVATTAGAYTLEAQKAELEQEKVRLADQLSNVREEKQRGFLAGESEKERGSREKVAGEQNKTHLEVGKLQLQGHLASAGATLEHARIQAGSVEKQIAAENERASAIQMNDDGTASLVNKVTGKVSPLLGDDGKPKAFRDPDMAKAQLEAVRVTSTQLGDLQRKYQTDVAPAHAFLKSLETNNMLFGKEKDDAIAKQRGVIADIEKQYAPDFLRLNNRLDSLSEALGTKGKINPPSGAVATPTVIQYDAKGNRITTPPPAAMPAPSGLINSTSP